METKNYARLLLVFYINYQKKKKQKRETYPLSLIYSSCFPVNFLGSPLPSTATASNSSNEGAINKSRKWNFVFVLPNEPSEDICEDGNESQCDTGLGRTKKVNVY